MVQAPTTSLAVRFLVTLGAAKHRLATHHRSFANHRPFGQILFQPKTPGHSYLKQNYLNITQKLLKTSHIPIYPTFKGENLNKHQKNCRHSKKPRANLIPNRISKLPQLTDFRPIYNTHSNEYPGHP